MLNLIHPIFCTFNMQQGNGEYKHKHFRSLSLDTHHILQMHFQSCNCLAISIVPDFHSITKFWKKFLSESKQIEFCFYNLAYF